MSCLSPATSKLILDVAEDLIQQYGYNGFFYADIANSIDVDESAIYHCFPTKADLGLAVVKRYIKRFNQQLEAIAQNQPSARLQLEAYLDLFVLNYQRDRRLCLCGMLGAEVDSLPDSLRNEIDSFFTINREWLTGVLQNGKAAGELFFAESPERCALSFLAGLEGAMIVGRGLNAAELVVDVGHTLLNQLTKP